MVKECSTAAQTLAYTMGTGSMVSVTKVACVSSGCNIGLCEQ